MSPVTPNFNLAAILPEILLLVAACIVLIVDVARQKQLPDGDVNGSASLSDNSIWRVDRLALMAMVPAFIALLVLFGTPTQYAFSRMVVVDDLATLLKICAFLATAASLTYARQYVRDREMFKGEFYSLSLFALLGQMIMMSASNMLVVYLGLELMSLSLYALAALRRDHAQSTEAAMKYFVLGALASGFLLYGMSMIYGGAGTLDLNMISQKLASGAANRTVFVFGVVFVVAGLAFKLGAVPFHMWVPDVYQGTPTAATLLIAGAPKLAAFAIVFRLLSEGLIGVARDWQQMLMVLSVLSLVIGNLVAISQTNLKRMLAYSTIAQIGFVLLGLLSGVVGGNTNSAPDAYSASMFYMITYVLTTLGTFGIIQMLARAGFESEDIHDLRGVGKRAPWLGFVMIVLMFSLAGIPPTVGFYAKLMVLQATITAGHIWLAVLAVMASLVGAFYYLRVIKVMFFDEPIDTAPIRPAADARALIGLNAALVLGLGLMPGPLMTACFQAIKQALGT
jgi:NADH-quinone oxidoreductase subunit N